MKTFRIATYNIHKCVGMDRKFSPERIAEVLREIDADIIALQEVLCHDHSHEREHQAEFLAQKLSMNYSFGKNRHIRRGHYGNAVLSRFEIQDSENFDITIKKREPRGCLRTKIKLERDEPLEFFNLHLGTSFFERRKQVDKLLAKHVLDDGKFTGNRMIAGDFNEWTNGKTTKLFKTKFNTVEAKPHFGRSRTYPGILPVFHLDHIYFDSDFKLINAFLHRSRRSLVASDHVPIVAEFGIK